MGRQFPEGAPSPCDVPTLDDLERDYDAALCATQERTKITPQPPRFVVPTIGPQERPSGNAPATCILRSVVIQEVPLERKPSPATPTFQW